jgi:hypothetical protein
LTSFFYAKDVKWWLLHNEELGDLYNSPNIVRVPKRTGVVALIDKTRNTYRILGGEKPLEM